MQKAMAGTFPTPPLIGQRWLPTRIKERLLVLMAFIATCSRPQAFTVLDDRARFHDFTHLLQVGEQKVHRKSAILTATGAGRHIPRLSGNEHVNQLQ